MPKGVYIRTDEYRQKQREAMARRINPGKNKSEETKQKISAAQIGVKKSPEFSKKCSERMKGKTGFFKGKQHSLEFSKMMSKIHGGENHHNWKGGISAENTKVRSSGEYVRWRQAVFNRDKYTCQFCGILGKKLNADHIKAFADHPELRFEIDNGRTLCIPCHKTTDTYGGKYFRKRTA